LQFPFLRYGITMKGFSSNTLAPRNSTPIRYSRAQPPWSWCELTENVGMSNIRPNLREVKIKFKFSGARYLTLISLRIDCAVEGECQIIDIIQYILTHHGARRGTIFHH